jgi:hypothetical protein
LRENKKGDHTHGTPSYRPANKTPKRQGSGGHSGDGGRLQGTAGHCGGLRGTAGDCGGLRVTAGDCGSLRGTLTGMYGRTVSHSPVSLDSLRGSAPNSVPSHRTHRTGECGDRSPRASTAPQDTAERHQRGGTFPPTDPPITSPRGSQAMGWG